MKLDIVKIHARRKAGALVTVDEIGVYFAYQIHLRERLNLPISTRNMLYEICSGVTNADIEAAYNEVTATANDPVAVEAYLQNREPLQKELRRQQIAQLSYEHI